MHNTLRLSTLFLTIFSLFSCATIARGTVLNQKLQIKHGVTKKPLDGVQVFVNGQFAGYTDQKGRIIYPVDQTNKPHSYTLALKKTGYADISVQISNKIDGGFVAGNIFLFLLGVVPGIVGLTVDGITDNWYNFKGNLNIPMQPIK
ncbi:MAG: hypothetical protein ACRCVN_02960 [Spirochaetia bacterium]